MKRIAIVLLMLCSAYGHAQTAAPGDSATDNFMQEAKKHLLGIGVPKDPAKALGMYEQHAATGHTGAMVVAGILHKDGRGTVPSFEKAAAWFAKAGGAGHAPGWYQLGMLYKDAKGSAQDYGQAYNYIAKAAAMGDAQSVYAQGYMLYKGLGCKQDYVRAADLFKQGAQQGRANSMYFYGLCLRNGYGTVADTALANTWLRRAAKKGYRQAMQELAMPSAENSNAAAKALAERLKKTALPGVENINQYKKIAHQLPAADITGDYEGYIIKYDWSGQHAIGSSALHLRLAYDGTKLTGEWVEADSIAVPMQALLTPRALVFKHTSYKRTDHYNPKKPMGYAFTDAQLQWVQKDGTMYLCGNVQMHSSDRNEPQKPQYIALERRGKGSGNGHIALTNADGSAFSIKDNLIAYPNPFTDVITIDFELLEGCEVQTQLLTLEGNVVYSNRAGKLAAGQYTLPIKTQTVAAGMYLLRLQYGGQYKSTKVIKF